MAITEITIEQRSADYSNLTDTGAKLVSLSRDGDAVLSISPEALHFITQQIMIAGSKPVIISTGSNLFIAGDFKDGKLEASLVRIVEAKPDATQQ